MQLYISGPKDGDKEVKGEWESVRMALEGGGGGRDGLVGLKGAREGVNMRLEGVEVSERGERALMAWEGVKIAWWG